MGLRPSPTAIRESPCARCPRVQVAAGRRRPRARQRPPKPGGGVAQLSSAFDAAACRHLVRIRGRVGGAVEVRRGEEGVLTRERLQASEAIRPPEEGEQQTDLPSWRGVGGQGESGRAGCLGVRRVGRALGAVGGAPACRPAHWCGPRRSSSSSPTTFQHEFLPQLAVAVWCGRISRPREGPRASRRLVAVGAAGRGAVCSPGARSGRASLGCCLAAHATADQLFSVMAKIVLQR